MLNKKLKEDMKTIVEMLIVLTLLVSISYNHFFFTGEFYLIYLVYALYHKYKNRNSYLSYVSYNSNNDRYFKITSIIIGLVIFFLGLLFLSNVYKFYDIYTSCILILAGILLFLNGLFSLPSRKLEIKGGLLTITDLKNEIDLNQIEEIQISEEEIKVVDYQSKIFKVNYLEINPVSAQLIVECLEKCRATHRFKITNTVIVCL